MDPHSFIARAEAQRWLGIAEKLLISHDLVGSKTFAIRARESDPRLEAADQILAIADTLLAAEKRVVGNNGAHQPDYYAILQLVRFVQDTEHIAAQYRRLALLLQPHQNRFPYSDQAFQLVNDAWAVLSNPMRKSMYDSDLDYPPQEQMNTIGFNLEQQQQQQQQPHNFFSINHMGAGHEQELPEQQQQTFQSRLHQSHQNQQLQQHNFLSQPNPLRPLPVREQEHMFQHREQEQLFQPQQVQPFQVTSPPPHQQTRPSPQPPQQQAHIQSPPPASSQSPFSWPHTSQLSQSQQHHQQHQHQHQVKQEQQHLQQVKQEHLKQEQQKQQQQQLMQEQLKQQQQLHQEQLKQQQQQLQQEEQRKQQQQLQQEEQRKQQQQLQLEEQLKQQQLQLEEQRKQQQQQLQLEEQRKQQQLLEEQRKQQQLLEEQRKQQQLLLEEQRKQQQMQEELKKQQQLLEEQRKQQQLLEEQRKQQQLQLEEQRKQQQLQEEQQLLEEQRKQQQLLEEQQKQQQQLQQERQQQELIKQNAVAASVQLPNQVNSSNGIRMEETETEPVDDSPTFWTACPYCFYMYEYPKVYVECTLRCDNCKRAFQAVRISSPPPIIEGQDACFYCWGFFPLGLSMTQLQKNNNKGTNSNWTPFSSLHNASNNVQNHLNEQAAPKENLFINKSSGPRIYFDDITDDVFIGVPEPSSDSDAEWFNTKKQKSKRLDKGFKDRIQVLALRAVYTTNGSVKNLKHGNPVQERVGVPTVLLVETSKTNAGSNPRKKSGRVAQESGRLDLNVEFNNNDGEETAPRKTAGTHAHEQGEEDNSEGVEFFEGLDEYLSSLPILSVVNEEKVKVA